MTFESPRYTAFKSSGDNKSASAVYRGIVFMFFLLVMVCALSLSGLVQAAPAEDNKTKRDRLTETNTTVTHLVLPFNIPRQRADGALTALGQQADITVVYRLDWVKPFVTNALQGNHTLPAAVDILLAGTGLKARLDSKGHLIISQKNEGEKESMNVYEMNSKKKILAATIGFFMGSAGQLGFAESNTEEKEMGWLLEEVVVTANKREQNLQDTAMSISAIGGDEIERKTLLGMNDYLNFVPNASLLDGGPGWKQVVIRGIGISYGEQSTVSTYFGEAPLTSSSRFGFSADLELVDIDRIEILRGPQGTLYGSGSLSGTIRYIPNSPNLNETEGRLDIGYGVVSGSDDSNNKVVGVLNLPLIEDELALRVVGYRYDNAGYIDQVSTEAKEALARFSDTVVATGKDSGGHTYKGGRASLLWQASDDLSFSFLYATQKLEEEGALEVNVDLGGYKFSHLALPGSSGERQTVEFDVVNLVLEYDLKWGSITASATQREGSTVDIYAVDRWVPSWAAEEFFGTEKEGEVYEIRLSSDLDGPIQFVSGIYYEDFEWTLTAFDDWYGNQSSLDASGLGSDFRTTDVVRNSTLTQEAFFSELTYSFNPQLELTMGGRWYDYDRRDNDSVLFGGASSQTDSATKESGANYKVNLSWSPNEESMLYALWSQGFRLGEGQVVPPASICDIDGDGILDGTNGKLISRLESDNTNNYELGGKFTLMDNQLILNASLFRIDWSEIPVTIISAVDSPCGGQTIKNNLGEARSEGLELEARYFVTTNLQLSLSAGYIDAEFLDDEIGQQGNRLPLSPEWNGTLGLEYQLDLQGYDAFIRSDYSYKGDHFVDVSGSETVDAYGKWDMRAGVRFDQFSVELYGSNLANSKDVVSIRGFGSDLGFRMVPRTLGIDVSYKF